MNRHDDLQSQGMPEEQPAMELLDGAEQAIAPRRPVLGRLVRGGLYGVLLLSASALLAISAVPELANYATFIPDTKAGSQCGSHASACTALNVAKLEQYQGSPCSTLAAGQSAMAGGCSLSCSDESEVAAGGCSMRCNISAALASIAAAATEPEATPATTLLTDEQLALLPEGEDLD